MDGDNKLFIKDLNVKTRKGYICVRVMRKWNYDANIPGGPILHIGLVFADEQGKAIYAQIPQSEVLRLGSQLMLDGIYTIRKFSVRISKSSYVPFDDGLMLQLTAFSTIIPSKVPANAFPKIIYNITPFDDIKTSGPSSTKYIDVIGILVSEEMPRTACPRGKEYVSTLKEVVIRDLSGKELTVTLWEDLVQQFQIQDVSAKEPAHSVVVLFCGVLPKKIFNKTQVNAGNACRWFLNPDVPEAQPFYESLKRQAVPIQRPTAVGASSPPKVQPRILEQKTVAAMNAMDPYDFPEEGCKCTVTITEIPQEQEWWYMGCEQCKRRLRNNGGTYYCGICSCSVAIPLYKLTFIAADDTSSATFFSYDVNARQIIRRNCDSLLRALNNVSAMPDQILRAVGRTFTFAVGLTEQSYRSMESRAYLVNSCSSVPQQQTEAAAAPLPLEASTQRTDPQMQTTAPPANVQTIPPTMPVLNQDTVDIVPSIAPGISGCQTPPPEICAKDTPGKSSSSTATSENVERSVPHDHVRKRLYTDADIEDQILSPDITAEHQKAQGSKEKEKAISPVVAEKSGARDGGSKKPKKT